ncbi:NAD(P)H-quinone oxidoreductase [Desmospora activa]|uniref:Putative PIG3 family NAD(P)H quinone oxidoreductase n=1 Tax=Desmospora activa DSM 45169 TaxID=1121389 RepID=A0A2T4ZD64_9BACL|nr:NAD(P)H-quinone oxidoreductase [Desmospora activa]PTM59812.1 putative PIG3 family NAD(P)H quinone oxidoreductase [Desmospora activa DSM 45169]
MRAVIVTKPGGPEQLTLGEAPLPRHTDRDLLVKVKATALNRADTLQRQGKYPPPPGASPILGLEMAGEVVEVGAECTGWQPGDRVFGLLPGGGYAEYAVIPGKLAMPIPNGYRFAEGAAIAEVYLTAYQALFWLGELKRGDRVLIHAGASGVGTAAIQLAKQAGAFVIVTAGSEQKREACRQLGADVAIDYKVTSFAAAVKEATAEGVDVVLDFVGAAHWEQNLDSLAVDGRWILISTLGGYRVKEVDLRSLMAKRIHIKATTLRSRSPSYKAELTKDFVDHALPLFREGKLKPVIDRIFSWREVVEAHRYMEADQNIGKIILMID